MKATDILSAEHRIIEQVLNCLEVLADRSRGGTNLDLESAREIIDFLRVFADTCHHGKEEAKLFPLMESKGFPRQGGPTGVMMMEHDQGRGFIRNMAGALETYEKGKTDSVSQFVLAAKSYIQLLREHIQKEDHCLFSMANQSFTELDQKRLLEEFEQVEHVEMPKGVHQKYLEAAERLAARFGVPSQISGVEEKGSCCGGNQCH